MGYRAMGISESYRWPEGNSKAHGWIFDKRKVTKKSDKGK